MMSIGTRCLAAFALATLASGLISPAMAESRVEPLQIATASGLHNFQVEVADDDASREKGLMDRRSMSADHGMLFEFQENAPVAFWMKNTYMPLDMIFISPAGVVMKIAARTEPLSETIIPSGAPCVAVLELNGGTAASIGLMVGDRIRHPFFRP